jgi:hypothetical protein
MLKATLMNINAENHKYMYEVCRLLLEHGAEVTSS